MLKSIFKISQTGEHHAFILLKIFKKMENLTRQLYEILRIIINKVYTITCLLEILQYCESKCFLEFEHSTVFREASASALKLLTHSITEFRVST